MMPSHPSEMAVDASTISDLHQSCPVKIRYSELSRMDKETLLLQSLLVQACPEAFSDLAISGPFRQDKLPFIGSVYGLRKC